jgi:hypothetical protein
MVEFLVRKPKLLEGDGGARLGVHIFDGFRNNFGFAGPDFIQNVFKLGESYVLDNVSQWGERFDKDFGDNSTYRFYRNLVSAVFTAGTIANNADITNLTLQRIYDQVILEMIMIRDKVIKVNRTDYESMLGDFVNTNMGKTLVIKDGKVALEPRNSIVARIDTNESLLQVSKSEIKKYLTERQISTREFEHDMRSRGVLIDDKKGRLTTGWKTAVSASPTYLYWFRTQVPTDWLSNDTESDS